MYKTDSSAFSLLSVLSADGKIFPKLFPYFKTYPTGTDRPHIHQSQTTSNNKAVQVSFASLMNTLIPLAGQTH